MKKLINSPDTVVSDFVSGLVGRSAHLAQVDGWNVVVRAGADPQNQDGVVVISGGGSGHEPAHAGYVGEGMLHAAVLGPVFTSPSVDAVYAAIRATAGPAGALLVVKNYTGDRLNFGLAAQMAISDGIPVELVVVADDVALDDGSRVGARGIAGTVLVHKIAGAAAAEGLALADVAAIAREFAERVASMGVATEACYLPGSTTPNFELAEDEVEWGLGIHGEPGRERGTLQTAGNTVARIVDRILARRNPAETAQVAVLVNGLGTTTPLELEILAGETLAAIQAAGLSVARLWAGNLLTALDMSGASISLVEVSDADLARLDRAVGAAAWPAISAVVPAAPQIVELPPANDPLQQGVSQRGPEALATTVQAVRAAAEAIIAAEGPLTDMDRAVGDGDLGNNLARGSRAALKALEDLASTGSEKRLLKELSLILRREVGGTSGPLYSLLALRASDSLPETAPTAADWAVAFDAGVAGIQELGGAQPGDRTMIDALRPAANALIDRLNAGDDGLVALREAVAAANAGVELTTRLQAGLGRSSYLGERAVGHPDPGARAVAIWLEAIADALQP